MIKFPSPERIFGKFTAKRIYRMITVAIVSPSRSMEPINKVIAEHDFGCEFHKYIYNQLSDIDGIYADCKDSCDVIFFSGELGYHYIRNRFPDIQLPCSFTAYGTKDVLSILLRFKIEHPEMPLNRVFIDFLTPLNNFMDMHRYIQEKDMPYFFEDSVYDYSHITYRTKQLWEEGKIDLVISRSINNLNQLDQLEIPYLAVFPSEEMIRESIEAALNDLKLNQIEPQEYLVILIRLPFENDCSQEEREYRTATLHKFLVDFRRAHDIPFAISIGLNSFELNCQRPAQTTTPRSMRSLILRLQRQLDFPFRVGIGLDVNEDRSHYFAEQALLEATRHGANDGFFVSGENETLTGPLSAATMPTYSYSNEKAVSLAHQIGISQANLLKLVGLFQSDPSALLSTAFLSQLLNITPRSASRILLKLHKLGLITPANEHPKEEHKGRPQHYFHFLPGPFQSFLVDSAELPYL